MSHVAVQAPDVAAAVSCDELAVATGCIGVTHTDYRADASAEAG